MEQMKRRAGELDFRQCFARFYSVGRFRSAVFWKRGTMREFTMKSMKDMKKRRSGESAAKPRSGGESGKQEG